jgi:hypothetical protein
LSLKHPNKARKREKMKTIPLRELPPSIKNAVPSLLCAMILLSIHSCATVPTTNAQSQGNRLKNSENQKGSEDEELNLPAGLTKAEAVKFSPPAGKANL